MELRFFVTRVALEGYLNETRSTVQCWSASDSSCAGRFNTIVKKYNTTVFSNTSTPSLQSFVGFVVFLVVLLRPPPSTLLPNLPHTGHKISVVILPPLPTRNLSQLVLSVGMPILTGECVLRRGRGGEDRKSHFNNTTHVLSCIHEIFWELSSR